MKKKEELNFLRREIQRERGTINALKRHLKRLNGKEVIHSSSEFDEERLGDECGFVPDDASSTRAVLKVRQAHLKGMRQRAAALKHEIESRLPLTPCGFAIALVRALWRRRRKRMQHI